MSKFLNKLKDAIENNKDSEESSEFIKRVNLVHDEAEKKSKKMSNLSDNEKEKMLEKHSKDIDDSEIDVGDLMSESEYMDTIKNEEIKLSMIADIENKKNEVKLYENEVKHYVEMIEVGRDYIDEKVKEYEEKYGEKYKGIEGVK